MLIRIVKLDFKEELVEEFLQDFDKIKNKVRNFEGCQKLKLLQKKDEPNVFFTYSYWIAETHLNNYRNSELFAEIWKNTKAKFKNKAEAWSVFDTELIS